MKAKFNLHVCFTAEMLDGDELTEKVRKQHDCPSMIDHTLKTLLLKALQSDKDLLHVYVAGTKSNIKLLNGTVNSQSPYKFSQ